MQAATAEAAPGRFERTAPYLRPDQVDELRSDINGVEATLAGPAHITAQIQDRALMIRQVRSAKARLEHDAPLAYPAHIVDDAVRRERKLRERVTGAMPTQAEMRKCPPGAIDKHRGWEKANKADILELKNIRRRLHAGGHLDDRSDGREVANIEQFRPAYASHELNMDGAQIPGKQFYFGSAPPPVLNAADPEEAARMRAERDKLAELIVKFPNATGAEIQAMLREQGLAIGGAEAKPAGNGKAAAAK